MASPREKAIAARVLRDAGHEADAIMDLLHASKSTVYRWLQEQPTETTGPTATEELERLLSARELDDYGRFRAAEARRLAMKFDKASASDTAQDSMAIAQIAKGLDEIVARIMDVSSDDKEWLAGHLSPVGDAANPEP